LFNSKLNGRKLGFNTPLSLAFAIVEESISNFRKWQNQHNPRAYDVRLRIFKQ